MSKQKMLNKWQRENISILDYSMVELIKKNQYARAGTSLLYCCSCGSNNITGPIVEYFNYEPTRLICYKCQAKAKKSMASVGEILQTRCYINS